MPTIIRKVKKISDLKQKTHTANQAINWQMQVRSKIWSPPTDLYETKEAYTVRVEVAGMRESDFTISIEGDYLLISGKRDDIQEKRAYHQMEIRCGKFISTVSLPNLIDIEKTNAEYVDGFLTVVLPKLKPKKIDIQE